MCPAEGHKKVDTCRCASSRKGVPIFSTRTVLLGQNIEYKLLTLAKYPVTTHPIASAIPKVIMTNPTVPVPIAQDTNAWKKGHISGEISNGYSELFLA